MPAKAGQIVVDITAGTARFVTDMETAKAKIREFGETGVSEAKATRAAFKVLEGQMFDNKRAAEEFAETIGGGKLSKIVFPVVSGAAFAGMMVDLGIKTKDFFKDLAAGPAKVSEAFRSLNEPLRATNDELQVANDRLENDIAKLEGRRQNNLKVMLDEAVVAADHLADSLDKGLASLNKLLKDNNVSAWGELFTHTGATSDLKTEFGGDTGTEGFPGKINDITDIGNARIRAATDAKSKDAAQTQLNTILLNEYAAEIDKVNKMLVDAREIQREFDAGFAPDDQLKRIATLSGALHLLTAQRDGISLQAKNTGLTDRKNDLTTASDNANITKPFENRLKALGAQLDAIKAKMAAIGQPESVQVMASAFGEAQKTIEELNRALDKNHTQLTEDQKSQIRAAEQAIAANQAESAWRERLEASTLSIDARIEAQQRLTAAIGKGYEATKLANIETQLASTLGEHYKDPAWMKSHSGDVDRLRSGISDQFDAEHAQQVGTAIDGLNRQISLERELAAVQAQGAEAVRQATLAAKLRQMVTEGATREQIQAEIELYNAQRANVSAASVAAIDQKITATDKLTAAIFRGAEAVRQAGLEAKYAEMQHNGATSDQIGAERKLDNAEHQRQITEEAGRTVTAYSDQLEKLNQIAAVIEKQKQDFGDTLEIEIALRDIENKRLELAVQEELKLRGAKDGVKAFFLEMQEDAKSAANIVYDALNSALDKVSDQFAKLFTGQKTSFGKMFEGIGQDMVKESTKSMLQKGLGELGKVFGIHAPTGKPDGTQGNPFHVVVQDSAAKSAGGVLGAAGASGAAGGILQGAIGKIGGFFSKLWGGLTGSGSSVTSDITFLAAGGDADPGKVYGVAEAGEAELVSPKNSSRITPLSKLGGGNHYEIHVDARNAELGVENRIERAVTAAHNAAVSNSVRANAERSKRTPHRSS